MKIVKEVPIVLKVRKISENLFMLMGEKYLKAQTLVVSTGSIEEMMMLCH